MKTKIIKLVCILMTLAMIISASALSFACTATQGTVVLTVVKGETTKTYDMNQLKKLTAQSGKSTFMTSVGDMVGPFNIKGVNIIDLCDVVGGLKDGEAVKVTAKDDYAMTYSYKQITSNDFITYDAATKKEVTHGTLKVLIAYEVDNAAIPDSEGPLRLYILANDTQATDGHWSVKWVTKLEIVGAPPSWTLTLKGSLPGGLTEEMTSNTFESGTAPGCHGATYSDTDSTGAARKWEGIPLWLLLGKVDDATNHGAHAFNDTLANAGYQVVITGAGKSATFLSNQIPRDDTWIIANVLNGQTIATTDTNNYPLKLVGTTVPDGQKVGGITKIEIQPITPTGGTVLTIKKGNTTLTYTLNQLQAMTATQLSYSYKKSSGAVETHSMKGVNLNYFLTAAGGFASSNSLKVYGSGNYTKTYTYDDITTGSIITTYDATTPANSVNHGPFTYLIAYEQDGAAVTASGSDSPLTFCVIAGTNQATPGNIRVGNCYQVEIL
ncbi:MAG: hypothetical protein NTV30_03335 [Chloroflexi bacterium]|nr:hypothetical protein [Chloroflexota bacterium]